MYLDSKNWDRTLGVCTLHHLPEIPCPACIAEKTDLEIVFSVMEALEISWGDVDVADLIPAGLSPYDFVDARVEGEQRNR